MTDSLWDGKIVFEPRLRNCLMCSGFLCEDIEYKARWAEVEVRYVKCLRCGYLWQDPPMSRSSLMELYNNPTYWGMGDESYIYSDYLRQGKEYYKDSKRRLKMMKRVTQREPGRVLEVGSGPGHSLKALADEGIQCVGIDPSEVVNKFARETYDLNCISTSIEDFRAQGQYDLVYSWGTSMNFVNPFVVYEKIYSLLTPGGIFFMDLFDVSSWFSILTSRKRKVGVHITCCPTKKGIESAHDRIGYAESGFMRFFPYYSVSIVGSILQAGWIKKLARCIDLRSVGLYAIVPGFYLFWARKASADK